MLVNQQLRLGPIIAVVFAAVICPTSAWAELVEQTHACGVQIIADQSPLGSVLDAMAAKFPIRYETKIDLQEAVAGTFTGDLDQVLHRLLQGYNYVITIRGPTIELRIIGKLDAPSVAVSTIPSIEHPANKNTNPFAHGRD